MVKAGTFRVGFLGARLRVLVKRSEGRKCQ